MMTSDKKETILLTGGSGRIGKFLVQHLDQKYNLITIGRKEVSLKNGKHLQIQNYTDFSQLKQVLDKIRKIDIFVHLGATVTRSLTMLKEMYETDLLSLSTILDCITKKGLKHVVFASSYMVYGFPQTLPIKENHSLRPDTIYGVMKQLSEKLFQLYQKEHKFSLSMLRISGVYGFGDPNVSNLIPAVISKSNKQQEISIDHNGKTMRDYIFVDDVVTAIDLSIKVRKTGIYNVGSGKTATPNEIISLIQKITKRKIAVKKIKSKSKRKDLVLDIERAAFELDFLPRISLEDGINKEIVRQLAFEE